MWLVAPESIRNLKFSHYIRNLVVLFMKGILFEVDVEPGVFAIFESCVTLVAILSPWLWISMKFPTCLSSVSWLIAMMTINKGWWQ